MLANVGYFFADLAHWFASHKLVTGLALLVIGGGGVATYLLLVRESDDDARIEAAPAPPVVVVETREPEETDDLGFPAFATKNTTRVAGPDPIADAAGVALAVYPSSGGVEGPPAVTLVDSRDWAGGLAAAALAADPVHAPILLTEDGGLPELTAGAIRSLAPSGGPATGGTEAFVVGAAAKPDGLDTNRLEGANAPELAAEIDRVRTRLAGEPDHILLTSSGEPELAMPAAGWAARSGDPILFVNADGVPKPTRRALERHEDVPVFVLGPPSAVPAKVLAEIEKIAGTVERVGAQDPVANAIAFARYSSGSFGWNINDPGHGFVIASTERPLDAAAAAPLSGAGSWGPLLVTADGAELPEELHSLFLDLKPGYEDDPTRAVYNHIWLVGDTDAISVDFQAQLDELAEVARVRSGTGAKSLAPPPGTDESQAGGNQGKGDETKGS